MKPIYLAFRPEDLTWKEEAEIKCNTEAKNRGFYDWWNWYTLEGKKRDSESFKFMWELSKK